MAYLTPTTNLSPAAVRRVINIPAHYSHIVSGALFSLTEPEAWRQIGADTPEQAAAKMFEVWWEFIHNMGYIGTIVPYGTLLPPAGILPCDGSTFNRVDYPILYPLLDPILIIDADTFNTPDLRDRTIVGAGGLYAVGDEFGEAEHTLTVGEMPTHDHLSHDHLLSAADPIAGVPLPSPAVGAPTVTGSTGGGNPHNNLQPSYAIMLGMVAY